MTDRRATDLSYGHLGEASYSHEQGQWGFSKDCSNYQTLQQILSVTQCQLPSIEEIPETDQKPSNQLRSQIKSLVKDRPETQPASTIASTLCRNAVSSPVTPSTADQLFSVGGAVDVEHQPGYRTVPIIAMPCGEAGHILRLIRPRIEVHGWGPRSSARLSMMDAASSDHGQWAGTGGTIQQITFADDGNTTSTWLAVRQPFVTTIFRPMYYSSPNPTTTSVGHGTAFPPSHLGPNPVAVLTAERTGSRRHVDVTFNPYYGRQFAVVDDTGAWSTWDLEGRIRKRSALELLPGKQGHIYDGYVHDPTLKEPNSADGWHRLLWVSTVSTIVVCNRRHLAVFDIKSTPIRLPGADIVPASSTDWVLDVKRSAANLSHLFVLTSSRIFWIEIAALREDKNAQYGARVILSQCHFRDPNDKTMKLTILMGDEDSVLMSSAKSLLVDIYNCSMERSEIGIPTSSRGSLTLSAKMHNQNMNNHEEQLSVYFLEAALSSNPSRELGSEHEYIDQCVKFYQVWLLSPTLGLKSSLCAFYSITDPGFVVTVPSWQTSQHRRHVFRHPETSADAFVVPDGDLDEEETFRTPGSDISHGLSSIPRSRVTNDSHSKMNWSLVFQGVFREVSLQSTGQANSSKQGKTMDELLQNVANRVKQGQEIRYIPMSTLLELFELHTISGDLEDASLILQEFLENLQANDNSDTDTLVISSLDLYPGIRFEIGENNSFPGLLQVYDQVGDQWMAKLPSRVSNLSRLSKFKMACNISLELCLSSIALSLRNEPSHVSEEPDRPGANQFTLSFLSKAREPGREDSPSFISSQNIPDPSQDPSLSLPTPNRTPSLYSHRSEEPTVDPAIARLRQYAVSINSLPDLGTSSVLSQWPSSPGQNPAQYKWKVVQKSPIEDDSGKRHNNKTQREEERRRRRTENFLNRERASASAFASQPTPTSFGSQPEIIQFVASSQALDDIPMTQPDRGSFGSGIAQVGKKKPKKRRAAGF